MIELLAPVGSMEAFYASINNHADAIYLGGKHFGARAYANNFSNEEIKEIIKIAHIFNVKVYVTVNTIVFDEEIPELINFLDFLYENDCDAVIVQDLGVLNIIRTRYPDFEIHASTQMNIHSVEEAKVLKKLGVKRIVVAREIDIDLIKRIKKEVDIEIEVFVHGALCISSSGKCYMSSIIGRRSGNRGRCAQPCRLEYKLKDEEGYLISPKDLFALPRLKELIDAGVDSLKIEGRMKRAEYVSSILRSYKKAINSLLNKSPFDLNKEEEEIKKIFNRGFTKGYLFNEDDLALINKEASNHQGIEIGKVIYSKDTVAKIKLSYELNFGDSIRIVGKNVDAITINQMYVNNKLVKSAKPGDVVKINTHLANLDNGIVYLTTSIKQIEELSVFSSSIVRKLEINGCVSLINDYICLEVEYNGIRVKELSNLKVQEPLNISVNDRLISQINKTNNTYFKFSKLTLNVDKPIYIDIKSINDLRRNALDELENLLAKKHYNRKVNDLVLDIPSIKSNKRLLKAKVRTFDQLDAVLNYEIDEIYVSDIDLLRYVKGSKKGYYLEPRVVTNDINYNGLMVHERLKDFNGENTSIYLNVANAYSVNLLEKLNANSIGLSLELSLDKIKNLIGNYKKLFNRTPNLEMEVYGRYELMHLKYRLGLKDDDFNNNVNLVDRKNFSFPLLLEGGYVKILNSKRLHLIDYFDEILNLNISPIFNFTIESKDEVMQVLDIYLKNKNEKLKDVTIAHIKEGVL